MGKYIPNFSERSREPEIMDLGDCTSDEITKAYQDLRRVNRFLGGSAAIIRPLSRWIRSCGLKEISVLDLGTGAADIPRRLVDWGRAHNYRIHVVALDWNNHALRAARDTIRHYPEVDLIQADALRLPFPRSRFDFVISSMFFHHLPDTRAADLLRELHRLVRVGFLVNDLHRHPVAYYAFWVLSRLCSQNRLIRHDGLISILRGFTTTDLNRLREMSGLSDIAVRRCFPYRLVLTCPRDSS